MDNERVKYALPSLLDVQLTDKAGARVAALVERIVKFSERYSGSQNSEGSEDSESSEGSEDSEGSEEKESCEIELLRDALATQPEANEWGVMLTAVEQLARVLQPQTGGSGVEALRNVTRG